MWLRFLASFAARARTFFYAGSIRDVADHLLIGTRADLLFDLHADGFKISSPEFLQDVHGDTLPQLDQPEEQMLRAHEIMVEPVGLLSRQRQHLLRSGA